MSVPTTPVRLMYVCYKKVFPIVHQELDFWKKLASDIPNEELRNQALASIKHKTFHCEGGSILGLLAENSLKDAIKFIVAYQTISDYLDNLCDRSTSQDPQDFRALHESMIDAVTLNKEDKNYYRYREDQDDGGYLQHLVATCQQVLIKIKNYDLIRDELAELCSYYCDLQVHKHVKVEERVERLQVWFKKYEKHLPNMEWYEFSACSGSTLGIFCLVSYALRGDLTKEMSVAVRNSYFPYIQGLHILLDYFIDQEEDREGGDLNFCFYYEDDEKMFDRFQLFMEEADKHTRLLPNRHFHQLINRGLLGVYLSDNKIKTQAKVKTVAKKIIRLGGFTSAFFYLNGRAYRKIQQVFAQ
ncbi:tetraprenyl-beta-curcumene synthase family protein [Bacillus kwashiorkori]|uniref:tetraprenyl-beta-curcumene synthase family protein n=1 Tax=Bacillus kwashiorkori TaxID=1522318 RepID=UPI0007836F28|nr:tetraprenyl-beta-curcumene synthase family protein [Bacillus kwashiorkori]